MLRRMDACMDTKAVFGISQSLTGQRWAWRGGIAPGEGLTGRAGDELLHQLFRARGAEAEDFARLATPTAARWPCAAASGSSSSLLGFTSASAGGRAVPALW